MRNRIVILLILLLALIIPAKAEVDCLDGYDFTGEAFFESPIQQNAVKSEGVMKKSSRNKTMPPVKVLRLKLQNKLHERAVKQAEFAPTAKEPDIYTSDDGFSEYASKEISDDFEEMSPDGFEADDEAIAEQDKKKVKEKKKGKAKKSDTSGEDIVLDCDNVDYDSPNYLIKATGNVNVNFVKQGVDVKSDILTFDRINNTIKAEGNVKIVKNGQVITGDYIFVDLNEENALIENPFTCSQSVEIRAKKGYVYGDKIVQEKGNVEIKESYPIVLQPKKRLMGISRMLTPPKDTLSQNMEDGIIKFKADTIKIKQKGDLEVISIKKGRIYKGERTIFKIPAIKIYTNKNHDYAETNFFEIGNYRGLGLYAGPSWVFELPKGSVLKAVPFVNNKSGMGVGLLGRFTSGTNQTTAAYGTAAHRFFAYGKQELDDDLFMQYSVNSYMDEWFLGRRRPKYGASIVYKKRYASDGFLIPNRASTFEHRIEGGFFHDLDFDTGHDNDRIKSSGHMSTARFRYMAQVQQEFYRYLNPEKLKEFRLGMMAQMSAAVYGTGDTQTIGRMGPFLSFQYKRWKQDLGYMFTAYDDNSPMGRYDAFRYGTQTLSLREYFRICRWLTISWFGSICVSGDTVNGRRIPENAVYFSLGPDDFKFHLGYDLERRVFRCGVEVMMDAKGANIEYNTFEIKQEKKAKKDVRPKENTYSANMAPTQPKVLNRAIVEDIKVMEDVL